MDLPVSSSRGATAGLLACCALAIVAAPPPSAAAPHRLVLDAQRTELSFTLGATAHTVEGKLFLRSGVVTFDPTTGSASGEVILAADRTETDNDRRDRKMHTKVLLSERFPQIRFLVESLEGEVAIPGASEFDLVGRLELLGKEHPFTVPLSTVIEGSSVSATSSFAVPYVDFGLHDPSVLVLRVEKHVDVKVLARGTLTAITDDGQK